MIYRNVKIIFNRDAQASMDTGWAYSPIITFCEGQIYDVKVLIESETGVTLLLENGQWFYKLPVGSYDFI